MNNKKPTTRVWLPYNEYYNHCEFMDIYEDSEDMPDGPGYKLRDGWEWKLFELKEVKR